jgi:hypothetical protein
MNRQAIAPPGGRTAARNARRSFLCNVDYPMSHIGFRLVKSKGGNS